MSNSNKNHFIDKSIDYALKVENRIKILLITIRDKFWRKKCKD